MISNLAIAALFVVSVLPSYATAQVNAGPVRAGKCSGTVIEPKVWGLAN
jgi:hypothetical protein